MKRYQPHPKQIEFLSSEVDELFYGGSRGGGDDDDVSEIADL